MEIGHEKNRITRLVDSVEPKIVPFVAVARSVERRPEERLNAVGIGRNPVRRCDDEDEAGRLVGLDAVNTVGVGRSDLHAV